MGGEGEPHGDDLVEPQSGVRITATMKARSRGLAPLLFAALLAACGGSDNTTGPAIPESLDTCTVFTPEQARTMSGSPVAILSSTMEDASETRNRLQCTYNAGTMEAPRLLSLEYRPAPSARVAGSRMKSGRSYLRTLSKSEVQDVPGLGDEAMWAGGDVQQLHARKGAVQIVVTMQTGGDALAKARQVAAQAIDRLSPPS